MSILFMLSHQFLRSFKEAAVQAALDRNRTIDYSCRLWTMLGSAGHTRRRMDIRIHIPIGASSSSVHAAPSPPR